MLGTEDAQVTGCPRHILEELLQNTLSVNEAEQLCRPVTVRETKEAMFSIGNDKAPRPNGYSSYFFKMAWSIVGGDVVDAILHFFSTGNLLSAFNSTSITLVPKS